MRWTAGSGLSAAVLVFNGRLNETLTPSRTSRAASATCSRVSSFSAPRWSCSPQRPQVLTARKSVSNSAALTCSRLSPGPVIEAANRRACSTKRRRTNRVIRTKQCGLECRRVERRGSPRQGRTRHRRRARDRPQRRDRARRRRDEGRRVGPLEGRDRGDGRRGPRHRHPMRRLRPSSGRADGRGDGGEARPHRPARRERRHVRRRGSRVGDGAVGLVADVRGERPRRLPVLPRRHPWDARAGTRRIVNVASGAAYLPGISSTAYSASKAAVHRFSETLANQLAGRIPVFSISPGTRSHPHDRRIRRQRALDAARVGAASRPCPRVGRLDALAGRYLHAERDDVEDLERRADEIVENDLNAIRLQR